MRYLVWKSEAESSVKLLVLRLGGSLGNALHACPHIWRAWHRAASSFSLRLRVWLSEWVDARLDLDGDPEWWLPEAGW